LVVTQDIISIDDCKELLDYLIKIVNNNFSRISEIWDPVEAVLLAYTDNCIINESKFNSEKLKKGIFKNGS
jgi:hypothetical protein